MKSPFSALVIWVTIFALALAGYAALRTKVSGQSIAVATLSHEIEARTTAAEHLAQIRGTLASLAAEEAAVGAYFVPGEGVVAFIEELQSRGRALGGEVEITSVAATPANAKGRPKLLIALSIAGPFDAVMRTLGSIEYAPYDLKVTGLTLTQGDDKGWDASVTLAVGSAPAADSARQPVAVPPAPVSASSSPSASSTPLP